MLYLKITLRNIWRSKNENLIYILTILFCGSIFFAFNHLENLSEFSNDSVFRDLCIYLQPAFNNINVLSKLLWIPMIFLIIYIDRFLLKSRSKEYSIYHLLGVPTQIVSLVMFIENFITGMIAVGISCLSGNILAAIIKCFLVKSMGFQLSISWKEIIDLDPNVCIDTLIFFGTQFVIVGTINAIIMSKQNFVSLINFSKKDYEYPTNRTDLKKWNCLLGLIFLLMLFSLYLTFNAITLLNIILSVGSCVLLVFIIYRLLFTLLVGEKYNLKHKIGIFNLKELSSSFSARKKTYRIITLTALVSLCTIAACNILDRWGSANINDAYVYDIQIPVYYDTQSENVNNTDLNNIKKYIEQSYEVSYDNIVHIFSAPIDDEEVAIIKLSDFNNLRKSLGEKEVVLKSNQFLTYISPFRMSKDNLSKWKIMKGNSKEILGENATCLDVVEGTLGNGFLLPNSGTAVILPDNMIDNLKPVMSTLFFNIVESMELNFNQELSRYVQNLLKNEHNIDESQINCETDVERKATEKLGGLTVGLLAIYLGGCAAIICSILLTIQNLTFILTQEKRYKIIYLLGIDKKQIKHKIWMLNLIHFGIPFILAFGIHIIIISIWGYQNRLYVERMYSGLGYLLAGYISPFLLMGLVICAFFIFTSVWSVRKVISYIEKG